VLAIAAFYFWQRNGHNRAARATCYIASACAVLTKGPAGLALPGMVICGFLALEGGLRLLLRLFSWPLAGVVALIVAGWYASAHALGGSDFFSLQILRENVERFLGTNKFSTKSTHLNMVIALATETLPWNLVLLWSLLRRLGGRREDVAGRFLHAWWISIFAVFFLAASSRAVYLLPLYPAVALLAARAFAAIIPGDTTWAAQTAPYDGSRPRLSRKVLWICIACIDLVLMLVNHNSWKDVQQRKSRTDFIEKIAATVPRHEPLLAAPEFDNTDLMVIAYRLRREIDRRPMTCARPNDYFLAPVKSVHSIGDKARVLAFAEIDKVALVKIVAGTLPEEPGIVDSALRRRGGLRMVPKYAAVDCRG
jgi:4-amino-4-deoxy-L-arabinose transferase-like glycosyltransferase